MTGCKLEYFGKTLGCKKCLQDALDYLVALLPPSDEDSEGATPLDDFDYELSQRIDEEVTKGNPDYTEFTSFEDVLAEHGMTMEDS